MRIKRWSNFIYESIQSNMYWISEENIKDIFQSLIDEGFVIKTSKVFIGYTGWSDGNYLDSQNKNLTLFDIIQDDVIFRIESYFPGWRIIIESEKAQSSEDLTEEFQSAISQLEGEGYKIQKIEDEDGNTNLDNIHIVNGSIITWIPEQPGKPYTNDKEEWSDGDILSISKELLIYMYQTEEIIPTEKMLSEIYDWKCDRIEGNSIYCHVDIEDMSRALLSRSSFQHYGTMLCQGIDIENYYGDGYSTDISSLFQYRLNRENEELLLKCVMDELGGLENFVNECRNPELQGKNEQEVISYLLKERFHKTLEKILKNSEVTDTIRETVSDWERQAHCDANQKELEEAFDDLVSDEGLEWNKKLYKEVEKYYYKKLPDGGQERVPYKENVLHYELQFQDVWIEEYGKSLRNHSLSSIFWEWTSDRYFDCELKHRFSDWGDVDKNELNKEISSILKYYIKN